ncbi:agamous-like MADS-box protein AGL29 [Syzygium oleosum]|uniref:agamous-like MADS-box protein AGL29 n=1 Tax=Syzygium oleosum TaxID=219896 RepID=UPI0024B89DC8|nr:agamous-like MADS-box protein AGL29 [Syzygium oleosum]
MAERRTRGHRRTEMRQVENEQDKLTTFSKRRFGIYKKASELVTLCGLEVGVAIFSPTGRPYSFAHPSIDSIANRFLNQNDPQIDGADTLVESYRRLRMNELNQQHDELVNQVKADKALGKRLKRRTEERDSEGWWEAPIEQLNLEELEQMKARMLELRGNLRSSIPLRNQGESSNQRNDPSATIANEDTTPSHDIIDKYD